MSTTIPITATANAARRFGPGRVLKLVFGSLFLLWALGFLASGGGLTWALGSHGDSGYFTTNTHHYQTSSYALSTESLRVSGIIGTLEAGLGTFRVAVTSTDKAKPLFVGIARTSDVDRYLARVEHDELNDIEFDPFKIDYRRLGTGAPTAVPAAQSFWQKRAVGTGTQTVTWPIEKGRWSAVVMNADGSRNVDVDAQLAARFAGAWWFVSALFALGVLLLAGGAFLLYSGVRARTPDAPAKGV